jgi:hypothetical protein
LLKVIDGFREAHGVVLAVTEFGIIRWEPGAARFLDDQIRLFEIRGLSNAVWAWDPSWGPWVEEVDAFNFRHGPDRRNHEAVSGSDLMNVILGHWSKNSVRPSTFHRSLQKTKRQ